MNRLLTVIVASLALTMPALANEKPATGLAKQIAPLVDAQTIAVAHVRLDKVDIGRMVQLAGKVVDWSAAEAAAAELVGKLAVTTLVNAGAKELFVILSLDGLPFDAFFVAIPVAGEEEGKKIAAALKLGLKLRDAREKVGTGELMVQPGKDFVLIASKNALQRLRTSQPTLPPNLDKALAAFSEADARLAIVLPDSLRRSLGELMPQLPKELGGGKTAPLLNGSNYFSAGFTLTPKFSAEATLQTDDAKTAAAMRTLLVDLMGQTAEAIAKDGAAVKMVAQLTKTVHLLTPSADNNSLRWKLSEDEMIQAVRPLVTQLMTGADTAQSRNNLKQIGVALHYYHAAHKHFPTGIRDKKGKLLLSWRVQILPYLDGAPLYEKFKLDEPWDSEHNITLVKHMPASFHSLGSKIPAGKTKYLVPVGKGLFFDGVASERKMADIKDGTANTIMVLEVDDNHAATWTAPDDLNIDQKQPLKGLRGNSAGGFIALFGDGLVRPVNRKIAPADFYSYLTIAGGESVVLP